MPNPSVNDLQWQQQALYLESFGLNISFSLEHFINELLNGTLGREERRLSKGSRLWIKKKPTRKPIGRPNRDDEKIRK